jgi:hypothetical protein
MPAPPEAWYVDPLNPLRWRYWDGSRWTEHTRDSEPSPAIDRRAVPTPASGEHLGDGLPGRHASRSGARPTFLLNPVTWLLALLIAATAGAGWASSRNQPQDREVVITPHQTATNP